MVYSAVLTKGHAQVELGIGILVVGQVQAFRQGEGVADVKLALCLERVVENDEQGGQKQQGRKRRNHLRGPGIARLFTRVLGAGHHICTSLFLSTFTCKNATSSSAATTEIVSADP